MLAQIPLAGDVAELIGSVAEKVENRSLLLDKFVFHKQWPLVQERQGGLVKWHDASRWSFVRIADGASQILSREAREKRRRAEGPNVEPENRTRLQAEARIADALAGVSWDARPLAELRAQHTRRFLGLFRSAFPNRSAVVIGQLEGRLAINLADSLIQNAGICLDRLFGLPFIPGSAIKGACRHTALGQIRASCGTEQAELFGRFRRVFGTADADFTKGDLEPFRSLLGDLPENQKGAIGFLPAHPVNEALVVVDLTNVHYPDYYRTGRVEDLSNEKPQPNPFPAVDAGTQFAFCLVLNGIDLDPGLLECASRWLETALTVQGLGAKTSAGYGWFSLHPEVLDQIDRTSREQAKAAEAKAREKAAVRAAANVEKERLEGLSPEARAAEELLKLNDEGFAHVAKDLGKLPEVEQRAFLNLLRTDKGKRDRWKTWKKKKPDLAAGVDAVRQKLSLPPLP